MRLLCIVTTDALAENARYGQLPQNRLVTSLTQVPSHAVLQQ